MDRYCIREDHIVDHADFKTRDIWVFYYSDGSVESVTGCWK